MHFDTRDVEHSPPVSLPGPGSPVWHLSCGGEDNRTRCGGEENDASHPTRHASRYRVQAQRLLLEAMTQSRRRERFPLSHAARAHGTYLSAGDSIDIDT